MKEETSADQAQAQLESIREMVAALEATPKTDAEELAEEAEREADEAEEEAEGEDNAQLDDAASHLRAKATTLRDRADSMDSDDDARQEAEQAITEDALSVEVRGGWCAPNDMPYAEEYRILLCTGGPAVQIIGTLNQFKEPESARLEHQDWGTPWTELRISADDEKVLLRYAGCFWYGE